MTDELLEKPRRRHVQEINLVPIIDMLTTIIFFLLLSMGFIQYNKIGLPNSSVSVASANDKQQELHPKLVLVSNENEKLFLVLKWSGANSGQIIKEVSGSELELESKTQELLSHFQEKFPNEKTLQVGMSPSVPYSKLVTLMDISKTYMPSIVLLSSKDAQRLGWQAVGGAR